MVSRQSISGALQGFFRNTYLWRNLLAIIGIASMMLPWVYLDGNDSSLSGGELIAFTFATGSERLDMIRETVFGALALFLVPPAVAIVSIVAFVKVWKDEHPVKLQVLAGLLPLLIVLLAGSITSSDHLLAGSLVFPQAGVVVMFLCQGALAVHSLVRGP